MAASKPTNIHMHARIFQCSHASVRIVPIMPAWCILILWVWHQFVLGRGSIYKPHGQRSGDDNIHVFCLLLVRRSVRASPRSHSRARHVRVGRRPCCNSQSPNGVEESDEDMWKSVELLAAAQDCVCGNRRWHCRNTYNDASYHGGIWWVSEEVFNGIATCWLIRHKRVSDENTLEGQNDIRRYKAVVDTLKSGECCFLFYIPPTCMAVTLLSFNRYDINVQVLTSYVFSDTSQANSQRKC